MTQSNLKKIIILFIVLFILIINSFCRDKPVDVIVAIDKSTSMVEKIEPVKEYINEVIIDNFIQPGDYLLVISFYGQANIIVSTSIKDESQKQKIKQKISQIKATGFYTDIGNVLDTLRNEVNKISNNTRKKSLILITDGKHDPPPGSKYPDINSYISHESLKNTKEKFQEGWKVIYLDIGGNSDPELIDELQVHHVKLSKKTTRKELLEKSSHPIGTIKINNNVMLKPVKQNGKTQLFIPLIIEDFEESTAIVINKIFLESLMEFKIEIIDKPFIAKLPPNGETKINIPLKFIGQLIPGEYEDNLLFSFTSNEHFEKKAKVNFQVKTFWASNPWLIILIIILCLLIIALIVLFLIKYVFVKRISFKVVVKKRSKLGDKDIFRLKLKDSLYLIEEDDKFYFTKKKANITAAKLTSSKHGLRMTVLKMNKIPDLKKNSNDILNQNFIVITEQNEKCNFKIESL